MMLNLTRWPRFVRKNLVKASVAADLPKGNPVMGLAMLVLMGCAMAGPSSAQVVISEFLAKNDEIMADGDGNYSDWIELYNTGDSAVDLTGWFLSDDSLDPLKWSFPAASIGAGEYLIVFASGQEVAGYTDPLGYLHTTFKLSGDGETVVLTRADGVTVAHQLVDFPAQSDDISYGIPRDATYTTLVASDESARALIPTSSAAGTAWHYVGYNDSSWLTGQQGVGYETGTGYGSVIGLNVLSMRNQNGSVYVRIPFDVTGADTIASLSLRTKYDDGFVAFLNGVEIARANAPASLAWDSQASSSHEADLNNYVDFDASSFVGELQEGANMLAIQGLNMPANSSDMLVVAELNAAVAGDLQTGTWNYLSTPTPGTANLSGFLGYVADTKFSIDRGFYTSAFDVEISCDTAGAEIYYTVDGTKPAPGNGTLYSAAITIGRTTVLRAAAFLTGHQPSNVDTQTYIFLDDIIAQGTSVASLEPEFPASSVNSQGFDYGMDPDIVNSATYAGQIEGALKAIPSISMVTDPDNLFDASSGIYVNAAEEGEAWERETSIELIHPDGTEGFQIDGGMRIRGESSTRASNPKHSFRFMFRSEYGTSRLNYPLFGDEGADSFKRIDLRTGQNFSWANQTPQYATWLYDIFTRDTHRDMNQPYTRGEYYHLYINGMYWGLYQTEERCDSRYAASYYGGDSDDFDAVKADGDTGNMYAVDGTRDAYEDLWAGLTAGVGGNAAYFALQGLNADGTENSNYTKLLDVDNVIDYMLLVYFTGNRDSPIGPPHSGTMPRNVTSVYNRADPDGFKWVAHDNEHSLEIQQGVNYNRFNHTLSSSFNGIDRMMPWWIHLKLMDNDEYALRFADRVHRHFFNGGALTASETANRMQARRDEIYAAVVAESARWGDSKGTLRTRDGDWQSSVNWLLNNYMTQRSGIVFGQIDAKGWYPSLDAPEFNQHGGSIPAGFLLSLSGSGTIYYTTDGSDPREVGGGVAGTAYGAAVPLTRSTQVKARAKSGSTWSALTEATFVRSADSPLRITEIMYHPAEGGSGAESNHGNEEFEFIELLNTGTEPIGLAGTEFSNGIYFKFSEGAVLTLDPGEYVVLVNNLEAFSLRYPGAAGMNIAGEYHGKFFLADSDLANNGEGITLVDGLGRTIQEFTYDDWDASTDGGGYSLTSIDPAADKTTWSSSDAWRPSASVGGTPGEAAADPDSDSDGMDDSWETLYFGSINAAHGGADEDCDGDGSSNLTEMHAGTDPTDPDSVFRISGMAPSASSVEVSWSSETGKTYTLQWSTSLTDGSWTDVATGIVGTPPTTSHIHYSGSPDAFYRVVVE